ncbi:MAG: hypothetical protein JXB50_15905 [Spirochaetes bacterium]|nr:hypothetical protein [Spirochaetota bacterium]
MKKDNKKFMINIKKKLSSFLTSEEGKITRKQAVKIASVLLIAGIGVSKSFSGALKAENISSKQHTWNDFTSGEFRSMTFYNYHGSHGSHGSHGNGGC